MKEKSNHSKAWSESTSYNVYKRSSTNKQQQPNRDGPNHMNISSFNIINGECNAQPCRLFDRHQEQITKDYLPTFIRDLNAYMQANSINYQLNCPQQQQQQPQQPQQQQPSLPQQIPIHPIDNSSLPASPSSSPASTPSSSISNGELGGLDIMHDDELLDNLDFMEVWRENSLKTLRKQLTKKKDCSIGNNNQLSDLLFDLLSFYTDSNISKVNMRRIVDLFNKYSAIGKKIPTLDTLISRIHNVNNEYEKVFYCSKHLTIIKGETLKACSCEQCSVEGVLNKENIQHFWTKSIASCISNMVDRVGLRRFQSHLSAATDTNIPTVGQKHFIKDCVDGVEYKRITDKWVIRDDPNTICLTISAGTDGGSVNKSNSKSINPLFFWINEIGLKHRFSYPLTSLAAYANHKIPYQILLSKFIDELNELDKGLTIVTKGGCKFFLKVRLFQMIVDLVAAKDLLQINGHSGLCGCRWCLHTGEKKGENTGVLYCVGNSSCNSGVNRVWNNMMPQFCKLQKNEISSFDGVIGISILLKLSYFRWTTQVACDILHNLLEGLCKKILKNICSLYKTLIPSIDERIKLIETPSMYHREIRSLNEAAKFKAIEYYMLFAYCKDVFKNIISENHFNILKSVETFIGLIMNPSEKSEQAKASLLQMAFNLLRSVEIEFGEEDITMASHTVLHFPLSIWNLGPLYTNSTFMLEDLMGSLTSSIYGGKANMDHKALENWSIHQMTSLKRVRQFTFQYEHGDIVKFSKGIFQIVKRQKEGGWKLLNLLDNSIMIQDHLSTIDAIPCFAVTGGSSSGSPQYLPVHRNDMFLL